MKPEYSVDANAVQKCLNRHKKKAIHKQWMEVATFLSVEIPGILAWAIKTGFHSMTEEQANDIIDAVKNEDINVSIGQLHSPL